MNSPTEEFRPVVGHEGIYEVSNLGRVKTLVSKRVRERSGGIRKTCVNHAGYHRVLLSRPQSHGGYFTERPVMRSVHRLVAEAFIPNPERLRDVNHIDGDKSNNAVTNLEWVSHRSNMIHYVEKLRGGTHWAKGQKWACKAIIATPVDGSPPVRWESASDWARAFKDGKLNRAPNVSRAIRTGRVRYGHTWAFADQELAFPKAVGE